MASLATIEDLELRLGIEFTNEQRPKVQQLLNDASARIRSWVRQQFSYVEDETIILRPIGDLVRLPNTPVISISSIEAVSGAPGLPDFVLACWTFDGIDKIRLWSAIDQVVNYPEWWYDFQGANTYRVTYTHGYVGSEGESGIPDDIIATCCAMVSRVMLSPSQVGGMVSERIGQYFYQLQQNQGAAGANIRLNAEDKEALAPYRRSSGTIQTTVA